MADSTIQALTSYNNASSSDIFVIVDTVNDTTKRIRLKGLEESFDMNNIQKGALRISYGGHSASDVVNARSKLGLAIGTNIQAYNAYLQDIANRSNPGADRLLFWDNSDVGLRWLNLGTNLSITNTTINAAGGGGGAGQGAMTLNIPLSPGGAALPNSNFPALMKNVRANTTFFSLDFDPATDETAYWQKQITDSTTFPNSVKLEFGVLSFTNTGNTVFAITWRSVGDGENFDANASPASTTDTISVNIGTTNTIQIATKTLTNGTTAIAAGDMLDIRFYRDASSGGDTNAGDVKFVGGAIEFR